MSWAFRKCMGRGVPEARWQCYNSPLNSDLSGRTTRPRPRHKMPFLGRTLFRGPTTTRLSILTTAQKPHKLGHRLMSSDRGSVPIGWQFNWIQVPPWPKEKNHWIPKTSTNKRQAFHEHAHLLILYLRLTYFPVVFFMKHKQLSTALN